MIFTYHYDPLFIPYLSFRFFIYPKQFFFDFSLPIDAPRADYVRAKVAMKWNKLGVLLALLSIIGMSSFTFKTFFYLFSGVRIFKHTE
jgi:hypothetical protein